MSQARRARRRVLLAMHWWEDRVFEGVARFAAEQGWVLDCRMRWTRELPDLASWKGDGIIANAGIHEAEGPISRLLREATVPCINLQRFGRLRRHPRVCVDHEAVGRLGARHLLELDLPCYGFVRFADNPLEQTRARAFEHELREAGKACQVFDWERVRGRLAQLQGPLGLMAANDANALTVITACLEAGLSVPEQVAVLGVDDSRIVCELAEVPLSSVNCDFERQGYEAARRLMRLMDAPSVKRGLLAPREDSLTEAGDLIVAPLEVRRRRSTDRVVIPEETGARALAFMRGHYQEGIGVAAIAEAAGCSSRRLQQLFMRHLGRGPLEELTRLRVEAALGHLRNPQHKLETVARLSGFSSRFHLLRAFARLRGQAPTDYRRSLGLSE